jgi:hypothetical protein
MISGEQNCLPGLIELMHYSRTELHGFEVDMSGRVILPEFHPRTPEEMSACIKFQSELIAATDAAA